MKIKKITGREIYDARGLPTLECELTLDDDSSFIGSVPTGISKSKFESFDKRDGGTRLSGVGVLGAIDSLESNIAPLLIGQEPNLVALDLAMIEQDGTHNKSRFGANAMLAASIAIVRAHAAVENMTVYELVGYLCEYSSVTLPFAMFNMIGGGEHVANNVRIQEMMVVPIGAQSFRECMEAVALLHSYLYTVLKKNFSYAWVTIEGALSANFKDDAQALEILMEAIEAIQKKVPYRFFIALDVAASHFYDKKNQTYNWFGKTLTADDLIDLYVRLAKKYPLFSIEDGLAETDEKGWVALTEMMREKVQLIGDDIFASNPNLIANGIEKGIATGAIIKPNQIGTITETLQAIKLCREYDMTCVVSHRSAETNDTIIVDLAVGASAGYLKAGGPARGEHLAKYNELLRIEDHLMLSLLNQ